MTKREIFDHIIDACARVCNVSVDEILDGRIKFSKEDLEQLCKCV